MVPARSSIALQRGENNDTRWAPPVFDVDGVRIAVIFDRELEMLPTVLTSLRISIQRV